MRRPRSQRLAIPMRHVLQRAGYESIAAVRCKESQRPHRCTPRAIHFYDVASFPAPHTSRMQTVTRRDVFFAYVAPPCAGYNSPLSNCACLCLSCKGGNGARDLRGCRRWDMRGFLRDGAAGGAAPDHHGNMRVYVGFSRFQTIACVSLRPSVDEG